MSTSTATESVSVVIISPGAPGTVLGGAEYLSGYGWFRVDLWL